MSDATTADPQPEPAPVRVLEVSSSPHVNDQSITTKGMMYDVLIGLAPALIASLIVFGVDAARVLVICLFSCLAVEWLMGRMLGKKVDLLDGSAAITGVILALSLPWSTPWWICLIGSVMAIALGKMLFGGLGFNIFNPAMVGRAFVMLSFAKYLGAPAYVDSAAGELTVISQATPLTAAKEAAKQAVASSGHDFSQVLDLFLGNVNGSLGETSALALLLGGIYLCIRRSASWEIPVGAIIATAALGGLAKLSGISQLGPACHLLAGAFMLGAFFIATDPVSSPLTKMGKFIYGAGFGCLVVILRLFSSYPEGVMFAVLLMNAVAPLCDRWTIPRPLGLQKKGAKA